MLYCTVAVIAGDCYFCINHENITISYIGVEKSAFGGIADPLFAVFAV